MSEHERDVIQQRADAADRNRDFPELLARQGRIIETPAPRGLGDRIHLIAVALGLDRVARAFERVTGKPCGCAQRRAKMNGIFPAYNRSPHDVSERNGLARDRSGRSATEE